MKRDGRKELQKNDNLRSCKLGVAEDVAESMDTQSSVAGKDLMSKTVEVKIRIKRGAKAKEKR